jgi:uncharacterized protein DUF1559
MTYKFVAKTVLAVIGSASLAAHGFAAEAPKTSDLAAFVNDDTFVAAQIDIATLPKAKGDDGLLFSVLPLPEQTRRELSPVLQVFDQFVASFRNVGVESVQVVAGLADIHEHGGPLLVFRTSPGSDTIKVIEMLTPLIKPAGQWWSDVDAQVHSGNTVLVGSTATLNRYRSLKSSARPDLLEPLAKLASDGLAVSAVFCPGADFRRVVRELWPQFEGPLAPMRGQLADEWLHLEFAAFAAPGSIPQVTLQAKSVEGAATFVKLLQALPAAAEQWPDLGAERQHIVQGLESILSVLPPEQDGARVTILLPTEKAQLNRLQSLFGNVADSAMDTAHRDRRLSQFRQLGIAMHMFLDARKHFPSTAIRDNDGNPLLSWRVAILPYLEGGDQLYKQFHLDETWDSPHNRTLITKMPGLFADPDPNLADLAKEGKTTFVVPVAPETIFFNDKGATIGDVTDGTAKTILAVEVEPLRAVVWTKPDDWEVDVQNPLRGVERDDRKNFVALFADGHLEVIPVNVDFKKLRGLLTRSGGELFDWP